jgi:hypothetical protein
MLLSASLAAQGSDTPAAPCFDDEVLALVRAQFAKYGPRSLSHEYFGFIYRIDGRIDGAVTRGRPCGGQLECVVNPAFALARVPKGAKVLGEWHTHAQHAGAPSLSIDDVRGAHANRHICCYAAFYSTPEGAIFRWAIAATSVEAAMATRVNVGSYRPSARER